jgi:isopentenyl-diphosphate delta-isomerase
MEGDPVQPSLPSPRSRRKLDHLRLALHPPKGDHGLDEVHLVHQSLPQLRLMDIDLRTHLLGMPMAAPLLISGMTGGVEEARRINRDLGEVAARLGLWVAVGSQRAGLEDPSLADTYAAVRERNPSGVVLANLGADATPDEIRRAVDMVGAQAIQLHLNAPQELLMPEGDRDFRPLLGCIARAVEASPVPVLVKESGFGLSKEAVAQLYGVGVRAVDVSGKGGTNFARIEHWRAGGGPADPGLLAWGIPTAYSLLEVRSLGLPQLEVVASGGLRYGSEVAKVLALGAQAAAMAGSVWRALRRGGVEGAVAYLEGVLEDLRRVMLLTGSGDVKALRHAPVVLTGRVREWAEQRAATLPLRPPAPA